MLGDNTATLQEEYKLLEETALLEYAKIVELYEDGVLNTGSGNSNFYAPPSINDIVPRDGIWQCFCKFYLDDQFKDLTEYYGMKYEERTDPSKMFILTYTNSTGVEDKIK
jgi:hypothetical protein